MPQLDNPRHERFAQLVAKGMSQGAAYSELYPESTEEAARANASRLVITHDSVKSRILELTTHVSETIDSLNKPTRLNHAKAALKISEKVAQMDVDEAFMAVPNILQAAKHASVVHGWQSTQVNVGIRLDEIARSAGVTVDLPQLDPGEAENGI